MQHTLSGPAPLPHITSSLKDHPIFVSKKVPCTLHAAAFELNDECYPSPQRLQVAELVGLSRFVCVRAYASSQVLLGLTGLKSVRIPGSILHEP
jgi:hypothetical protein